MFRSVCLKTRRTQNLDSDYHVCRPCPFVRWAFLSSSWACEWALGTFRQSIFCIVLMCAYNKTGIVRVTGKLSQMIKSPFPRCLSGRDRYRNTILGHSVNAGHQPNGASALWIIYRLRTLTKRLVFAFPHLAFVTCPAITYWPLPPQWLRHESCDWQFLDQVTELNRFYSTRFAQSIRLVSHPYTSASVILYILYILYLYIYIVAWSRNCQSHDSYVSHWRGSGQHVIARLVTRATRIYGEVGQTFRTASRT